MKQWNCLQVSLRTGDYDKASGLLWDLGTQGIEERHLKSSKVQLKAYFDTAYDMQAVGNDFKSQCERANVPLFSLLLRIQRERDWFRKWRKQLKPFPVGNGLYLIPCSSPEITVPDDRIPIWIEPGMAFGTGTHETTQLCLEVMEEVLSTSCHILDIGTGSGILAIAAAKLGASKIVACDIDPVAIRVASANAVMNQCVSRIRWISGDVEQVGRTLFDLLVANLTVEIIEESLVQFEKRLKSGGLMVLSGILNQQVSSLRTQIKKHPLLIQDHLKKGEWACLILKKR